MNSQGPKLSFHSKLSHQGLNLPIIETPGTFIANFGFLGVKHVIFSNLLPKDQFDNFFDFLKPWVDFSFVLKLQGLVLPNFETWGTETANCANFVRFSFVFKNFASKTYKTHF